jgi:hypothetical protein
VVCQDEEGGENYLRESHGTQDFSGCAADHENRPGWCRFIRRSKLEAESNGYLQNDTIIFRAVIEVVEQDGGEPMSAPLQAGGVEVARTASTGTGTGGAAGGGVMEAMLAGAGDMMAALEAEPAVAGAGAAARAPAIESDAASTMVLGGGMDPSQLTVDNVCHALLFADEWQCEKLRQACLALIQTTRCTIQEVASTEAYKKMSASRPHLVVDVVAAITSADTATTVPPAVAHPSRAKAQATATARMSASLEISASGRSECANQSANQSMGRSINQSRSTVRLMSLR